MVLPAVASNTLKAKLFTPVTPELMFHPERLSSARYFPLVSGVAKAAFLVQLPVPPEMVKLPAPSALASLVLKVVQGAGMVPVLGTDCRAVPLGDELKSQ